jgi:hypothetical protein
MLLVLERIPVLGVLKGSSEDPAGLYPPNDMLLGFQAQFFFWLFCVAESKVDGSGVIIKEMVDSCQRSKTK